MPDSKQLIPNGVLLARGHLAGATSVHKFGAATNIDTTLAPVTTSGTYQTPTSAVQLEVVSDSSNDNGTTSPLGTGATQVTVQGLTDWDTETTETVTLNGTTPVATSNTWLRVYRMWVSGSGTYASTAGSRSLPILCPGAKLS